MSNLYQRALNHFGEQNQRLKLVEEMAELTRACVRFDDFENFVEEIADVQIMLEQMIQEHEIGELVSCVKSAKLKRLEKLLDDAI